MIAPDYAADLPLKRSLSIARLCLTKGTDAGTDAGAGTDADAGAGAGALSTR